MENKLIITKLNNKIFTMLTDGRHPIEINCYNNEEGILGNLYIVKIRDIVTYLNAAFIDYEPGKRGYYPIDSTAKPFFINRKNTGKVCQGDEILLQVQKEGVKTKDPVFTSNINIKGKYVILTVGKCFVGFSNKITDEVWKSSVKATVQSKCTDEYGFIIRTNAADLTIPQLSGEIDRAIQKWETIRNAALHRTCYSVIQKEPAGYITDIRNGYNNEIADIITDNQMIYEDIKSYLASEQSDDLFKLKFYDDQLLPLYKLYNLEKTLAEATNTRVWLKSGAYLVIEPTEALTVIDVNTGKYQAKKKNREVFLKINKEAAIEIARQLRLRNISGIIIIDFINMDAAEDKAELLAVFQSELKIDPLKTTLVGMTQLGLVELTRKKVRKSLAEQF